MALTASEVYSGGQVRDLDGREVVTVANGTGGSVVFTNTVALGNRSTNYALAVNSALQILVTATLTGSWTLSFTGAPAAGTTVTLSFTQDVTGGRVVTLPAATFPAGAFAINTAANATTLVTYVYDGAQWYAVKTQAAAITVAENLWRPTSSVGETFPRNARAGVALSALATQRMTLTGGMVVPANQTVSHLTFWAGSTAGATLTHQWAALISQDRSTILSVTNDDTSASWTASTAKTFDLATPYTATVDTPVVVGLVCVGTTMPTILGTEFGVNSALLAGIEPMVCAVINSATLTNPASLTSVGAVTAAGTGIYCYAT